VADDDPVKACLESPMIRSVFMDATLKGLTAKDQLRLERGVTPAADKPKQEA
jgi:hypothetical protein